MDIDSITFENARIDISFCPNALKGTSRTEDFRGVGKIRAWKGRIVLLFCCLDIGRPSRLLALLMLSIWRVGV